MTHFKKSLGQNFLTDRQIVAKIITYAEISPQDILVEIGPGRAVLTEALVETKAQVLAIEKDNQLAVWLRRRFKDKKNIKIIHQDALFFDYSTLDIYKVIANLPFNIASPIISRLLAGLKKPELMVLMVQKEVAQKIVAPAGSAKRGILTLAVELYAYCEIVFEVLKTSFSPRPKVDAAVIKIRPYNQSPYAKKLNLVGEAFFFKIAKAGFASKRRQIHNSFKAVLRLDKDLILKICQLAKVNPSLRAEDLNLNQWLELAYYFKKALKKI